MSKRKDEAGEDDGSRLEHQGIQRRPDLDCLVAMVDAADRAETIGARPQLVL